MSVKIRSFSGSVNSFKRDPSKKFKSDVSTKSNKYFFDLTFENKVAKKKARCYSLEKIREAEQIWN